MGRSSLSNRENHGAKVICDRKTGSYLATVSALIPGWKEPRAMKASRRSEGPKAFILKQGIDGMPVADAPTFKSRVFSRPSTEIHDSKNRI